ncbi:GGDEF domain-containing protein, partial [Butyricicoccus sp. 1XD8-22]
REFNDTYGHLSGDECLQKVTKSIQEFVKEPTSFAARYGGEEFCVVLLHESEKEAFNLAENIRESVMQLKIKHETLKIHPFLTVSSGVVTLMPEGELQLEKVFSMADKALYESKQNGRNKVTQYI